MPDATSNTIKEANQEKFQGFIEPASQLWRFRAPRPARKLTMLAIEVICKYVGRAEINSGGGWYRNFNEVNEVAVT